MSFFHVPISIEADTTVDLSRIMAQVNQLAGVTHKYMTQYYDSGRSKHILVYLGDATLLFKKSTEQASADTNLKPKEAANGPAKSSRRS